MVSSSLLAEGRVFILQVCSCNLGNDHNSPTRLVILSPPYRRAQACSERPLSHEAHHHLDLSLSSQVCFPQASKLDFGPPPHGERTCYYTLLFPKDQSSEPIEHLLYTGYHCGYKDKDDAAPSLGRLRLGGDDRVYKSDSLGSSVLSVQEMGHTEGLEEREGTCKAGLSRRTSWRRH